MAEPERWQTALFDDTTAILADLIEFPTVSSDSNLDLIHYAAEKLEACGADIFVSHDPDGGKANLFATLGPDCDGGIVLSGHTDVVPADASEWTTDPFQMSRSDGLLYGRGACDMKGFVAAELAMAPRFAAADLARPIHFSLTYDEETGCIGARQLVNELASRDIRPSAAIIGEPTEMRVIEGHKGCYEYTTEFFGREGHGSEPDSGVNAVEYAVRYIARLLALSGELKRRAPPASRFEPPHTTLQVGRIEGGSARNVIAGHCAVDWEMRPANPDDADFIKAQLAACCAGELLPAMRARAPEADIRTCVIGEVEGLEPVPHNEARDIIAELTVSNSAGVVAFGTEAGLFQSLGMSAVVCGPGSIAQAHKPDEFIAESQLRACLDMLDGLRRKVQA